MRGGGDIASGAVYRLKRAGYPVVINEIAIPTMIRREGMLWQCCTSWRMILERFVARHVALQGSIRYVGTKVIYSRCD